MGKSLFINRAGNYQITKAEIAVDEAYGIVEARFPVGSYVLPYGDAVGVTWKSGVDPYKAIHILTFDEEGNANTDDVMALSTVAYTSYGEFDPNNRLMCNSRPSKAGHLVPDAELIASSNPFHWDMNRTGNVKHLTDGSTVDLVNIHPRRPEVAKIIGEKWVVVAVYDENHDVVMVNAVDAQGNQLYNEDGTERMTVKFARKRKPIFQVQKKEDLPEVLRSLLENAEVTAKFPVQ